MIYVHKMIIDLTKFYVLYKVLVYRKITNIIIAEFEV